MDPHVSPDSANCVSASPVAAAPVAASPVCVVTVNGARLAYQEFGPSDAATIVLVAGGASSMDWWDEEFCRQLAAGPVAAAAAVATATATADRPRRVVRYDLRDTGQSETVAPGQARYTGSDLVDDLAALIEHLHAAPAHVVGLSMGGALVQRLALRRPELLASVTLVSTTSIGGSDSPLPPPVARLAASFDADPPVTDWSDPRSVAEAALEAERLYSGSIPVDEVRIRRIATAALARTGSPASADNHWSIDDGPASDAASASATDTVTPAHALPTLVIHGSDDPLFPLPHGVNLAESIDGARLVVVPGMGHQFPPPPTWPQIVEAIRRHTA